MACVTSSWARRYRRCRGACWRVGTGVGIGVDVKISARIEQADAMMRLQIKTLVGALSSCKSVAFECNTRARFLLGKLQHWDVCALERLRVCDQQADAYFKHSLT